MQHKLKTFHMRNVDMQSHRPQSKFTVKELTQFPTADVTSHFRSNFQTKHEATERLKCGKWMQEN